MCHARALAIAADEVREVAHDLTHTHGSLIALGANSYNFAKRLKTLRGLTPYEAIYKAWADEPNRFRYDPTHLISGLNT